jgi:hypothetical protein
VSRGHRQLDRAEQVHTQFVEVDLIAEAVREPVDGARCVVPGSVEAPIDGVLHAAADRLEERKAEQGRSCDRDL